jgi:hypothetical protein
MKKPLLYFLLSIFFAFSVSGQNNEVRKSVEFGWIPCAYFNALMVSVYKDHKKSPEADIHVIYYEGKSEEVFVTNKKMNAEEKKLVRPRRGNALNRAREVPLFLEALKIPREKVVLIDGGFRENFEIEVWIVPKNGFPPQPIPTVAAKDVKFQNGKPLAVRTCAYIYGPIAY